jgi:hypothetical protein
VEISPVRCIRYAGERRDPSLRGLPRTGAAECCESSFGFDPQLAARSCELGEYLGESEELACVHRFEDEAGRVHELRLTPIVGLEPAAAIALHESGEFQAPHQATVLDEGSGIWLSSTPTRHWALVPGWSAVRRLSWESAACSPAAMQPVLAAMAAAAASSEVTAPLPRLEPPELDVTEAPPGSLLARYVGEPAGELAGELGRHPLPDRANELIDELMRAAAAGEREAFVAHFEDQARWGLPDRRQLAARPVHADEGAAALSALRHSAARLPGELVLHCPELDRRMLAPIRRGEALMWCMWTSPDYLDLLVFAIRGHIADGEADARVEYLGLFPAAPLGPVVVPGEPPPPPMRAMPPIICGDPHAVDYPGLCPEAEREDDDEEGEPDEAGEGDDSPRARTRSR